MEAAVNALNDFNNVYQYSKKEICWSLLYITKSTNKCIALKLSIN